jgi:SPASM domain peptide maturase of grasp-with-spasm system
MQFANCIAVKGFSRTAIYDVQRRRYILVDNQIADLLHQYDNKIPLEEIDEEWRHYIDKLIDDEWGILTSKSIADLFPSLNLQWKHYAEITNTLIDLNNNEVDINKFFSHVLPQLETLSCKTIQVNFLKTINYENLFAFLERFSDTQVHLLVINLPYILLTAEETEKLYKIQPRLNCLCYYSSPPDLDGNNKHENSFYFEKGIQVRNNNIISANYFTTNIVFFTESQQFNTYYNRKISIDATGNIKNTPEQTKSYGSIKTTPLKTVLQNDEFKTLWNIHKGMIDVCKDCEYRHMCVDSCDLVKRKDGTWYRAKECNYNPFIAKWANEEDYKSLSECGIHVGENKFSIDNKKLNAINEALWGDE